MINIHHGDLLSENAEALVNTVNTEGVSGRGIALQFKLRFPQNYKVYRTAAKRGEIQIGKMLPVWIGSLGGPKWIINFPTKKHWRTPSRLDEIEQGLDELVRVIKELEIRSIAVPPLGCGNGGLEWRDVHPIIELKLGALEDVDVHLFPPEGAPSPSAIRINSSKPRMTVGRSTILAALHQYLIDSDGATRLVVQKIAYLLQASGVKLKLDFKKAQYGPYAEQVNFVLQNMEGHYTSGYGDRDNPSPIQLLPGAFEESLDFLRDRVDLREAVQRVSDVMEGFESPYGLELLTTVHFVATQTEHPAIEYEDAVGRVKEWSKRKDELFTERHIRLAWERLASQGWIGKLDSLN
jgi:O-acetyl-ADP-ribose deacetylase (regulator of RNase III)